MKTDYQVIDIHAHVAVNVLGQIKHAAAAGVAKSVLLSTRVHPEAASTLQEMRSEFQKLTAVIGGDRNIQDAYNEAMGELNRSLAVAGGAAVGFLNLPLNISAEAAIKQIETGRRDYDFRGIGELTPAPGRAADIEPIIQAASRSNGLPVLVHGFAPNTAEDITTYGELAGKYPDVPIIVGAFGGLNAMILIDLAKRHKNLYIDLSSALQLFAVKVAAQELPEQCLFGSNTPYGDPLASRIFIEAAVTDPVVRSLVLYKNAVRLLKI